MDSLEGKKHQRACDLQLKTGLQQRELGDKYPDHSSLFLQSPEGTPCWLNRSRGRDGPLMQSM